MFICFAAFVELRGVEPLSKHGHHKSSTCLVPYYLSVYDRTETNQSHT